MLTKFNDSNDMNTLASDTIHSYIKDGYRIDAKESVIDREKDKDCTFKAVMKKDVDGIECKTVITLSDNGDDKNKHCTYHKVDTVGDTRWSEETRTYSLSTSSTKDSFSDSYKDYYNQPKSIFDYNWITFGKDWEDRFKRLADIIKTPSDDKKTSTDDNKSNADKKDTKWRSALDFPPSAYQRLDDYIKLNTDDNKDKSTSDESEHIKIDAKSSEADIYNKIVDRRKNLEEACNAKARADKKKVPVESLIEKRDSREDDDELEDSLIKLVRYIFGR